MKRRTVVLAIIVLVLIGALVFFYVRSGKRTEYIRTTGIVEGLEVNVSTKVPGKILELCCKEGDTVRQGDTILKLENDDLRAAVEDATAGIQKAKAEISVSGSAIESSRANLGSAAADIKRAEADVEASRSQMEEAKRQMERFSALYKRDVISKQSLDTAATAYETALANHDSAKARLTAAYSKRDAAGADLITTERRLNSSRAGLKQTEANLAYTRAKLADTVIKAPLSGVVVFKALEKGETVSPGVTVLTIVDLNDLYVRADIDETLVDNMALNSQVVIKTIGTGQRLRGKVTEISKYGEFATQRDVIRGRQDLKTFKVKVAVENSGGVLKPGMTVEVEIPKRTQNG